jgi:hypothetical protein
MRTETSIAAAMRTETSIAAAMRTETSIAADSIKVCVKSLKPVDNSGKISIYGNKLHAVKGGSPWIVHLSKRWSSCS